MIINKIPPTIWEELKYPDLDSKRAIIDRVIIDKVNDIITELGLDKPDEICKHCKEPIRIRKPKSWCDHLYYPDNCIICRKREMIGVSKTKRSSKTNVTGKSDQLNKK